MNTTPKQFVIDMLERELQNQRDAKKIGSISSSTLSTQVSVINEAIRWAERQPER